MITNTSDIQAVYDKNSGICGIAFYRPGSVTLAPGLFVGADRPCLLLFKGRSNGSSYRVTVSDPTTTHQELNIMISKRLTGGDIFLSYQVSFSIRLIAPQIYCCLPITPPNAYDIY